ncbi:hypothetical protein K474DRAFT_1714106 [Panus rudis PR-1116 ss-1]|nr:hypothetical protein K474DRAFT_1714106 [Panus rudis PR-1116 ss-1]
MSVTVNPSIPVALKMALAREEARAIHAAIHALNSGSDSDNAMKSEIEELGEFVDQIANSMDGVLRLMRDTAAHTSGDLGDKINAAYWNWIGISTKFIQTVLLSSTVTGDALATSEEFIETVLPALTDESKTIAQRKQFASSFLDTLKRKEGQAQDMSQGFSDVSDSVEDFLEDLHGILSGYNVDNMEKRVKELDGLISKLLDDMKSLKSTLDSLNSQLESAQSAEEATGILGFLCPLWWIGTAMSASQISALKEQLSEVRDTYNSKLSEYRSKEAERQNLQADLDGIPLLRTTIEKAEPDIRSVIYKIGSIATCWAAVGPF